MKSPSWCSLARALCLAAFAVRAHAGTPAPADREQQLARQTLGRVAAYFTQFERPTGRPGQPVLGIRFATAGHSAGEAGLCVATVASATVGKLVAPEYPPLSAEQVYKVVGDLAPIPGLWNATYGRALERRCMNSGRVIPTAVTQLGEEIYFETNAPNAPAAWIGVRAVALALKAAQGDPAAVACKPFYLPAVDPADCSDRGAVVRSLALHRLLYVGERLCGDGKDDYCIDATSLDHFADADGPQFRWFFTLRAHVGLAGDQSDILTVSDVSIQPDVMFVD